MMPPESKNPEWTVRCRDATLSLAERQAAYGSLRLKLTGAEENRLRTFLRSSAPVEIEIGCGKAKYLIHRAERNPAILFIAIDRVGKWMNIGAKRAEKRGLENMLFLKAEAYLFLTEYIPAASVAAFHINFPDPWPKKRHHKRRMIQPRLLELLYERLKSQGAVYVATDDPAYRKHIEETWNAVNRDWNIRFQTNRRFDAPDTYKKTNYEEKWQQQGKTLYYYEAVKP